MATPSAGWDQYRRLLNADCGLCVSLYQPAHRTGAEVRQDPIRFKNLLKQARAELEQRLGSVGKAEKFLKPAEELTEDFEFWRHQDAGLAVFVCANPINGEGGRRFVAGALGHEVPERVFVGRRFVITPLLPAAHDLHRFFIVAVSEKRIRLYEATRRWIREIDDPQFREAVDVLSFWDDGTRELQFKSYKLKSGDSPVQQKAAFHGHEDADHRERIRTELRIVNEAVTRQIDDNEIPLVFAGVEELFPLYRDVNTHSRLAGEIIRGNADAVQPDKLRDQAWQIVEPLLSSGRDQALEEYHRQSATDRTSTELAEIVPAAGVGAVDTLLIVQGTEQWGTYNPETQTVEQLDGPADDAEDLINLAATETIRNSGQVFCVPPDGLPSDVHLAAVYRYAPAKAMATEVRRS